MGIRNNQTKVEDWVEQYREDDGELLGFLAPAGARFVAMTVFGSPLAGPLDRADAQDVLETCGLSYLADRWHLQTDQQARIEVQIVEASPEHVVVKNVDYGSELDYGHRFSLAVPVDARLTRN